MPNSNQSSNLVYGAYTPMRNFLRKMDLFRSLQAIWAHVVFQQYHRKLPRYITHFPFGYNLARTQIDFLKFYLHLWELETITKEVVLNSSQYGNSKSLENWNNLSKAVNHLKAIENVIAKEYSSSDNVLVELHRISHRQFPWQTVPNNSKLIRYWKIYYPLQQYFHTAYSIDFDVYITIGMMLFGFYLDHFALSYPPDIQLKKINKGHFDQFLQYTCKNAEELATELKSQLRMNHDFVYSYHSLKAFPLIKITNNNHEFIVCPLPTVLLSRITEGLFYDLINQPGFDNDFGASFQSYVGQYLTLGTQGICSVFPEQTYGPRRHKRQTVDWIVLDNHGDALFIECKTKRMTVGAKSVLDDLNSLQKDLRKLAEAVVQIYETVMDYEKGLYTRLNFEDSRKIYLLVATLEEWYLFGDKTQVLLDEEIATIFEERGMDQSYLKKYPYFVVAAENIELLTDLLNKRSISEIFAPKMSDPDKQLWHIRTYLLDQFPNDFGNIRNPFEDEHNQFLDDTIKKM